PAHQIASQRNVLPTAERGLGAERNPEFLIGDDLQQGIVAQTIGVIGIFVSGHDLIEALSQQHRRIVLHALFLTWVAEAFGPVPSQMMALIEGAQRQQTGSKARSGSRPARRRAAAADRRCW